MQASYVVKLPLVNCQSGPFVSQLKSLELKDEAKEHLHRSDHPMNATTEKVSCPIAHHSNPTRRVGKLLAQL